MNPDKNELESGPSQELRSKDPQMDQDVSANDFSDPGDAHPTHPAHSVGSRQRKSLDTSVMRPHSSNSNMAVTRARTASANQHANSGPSDHNRDRKREPGFIEQGVNWWKFGRASSIATPSDQTPKSTREDARKVEGRARNENPTREPRTRQAPIPRTVENLEKRVNEISLELSETQKKERMWEQRANELHEHLSQLQRDGDGKISRLQEELHLLHAEKLSIQDECDSMVRKQQEASFRQMEAGRWVPTEESKVIAELERLKREMKAWAKAMAIGTIASQESLGENYHKELMDALSCVVVLKGNELSSGLQTAKSASLLLNALLSHHIYEAFFRNPFFLLDDGLGDDIQRCGTEKVLSNIYRVAQKGNVSEANIWRSDTMRFLLPSGKTTANGGQRSLRGHTEKTILDASDRQASKFFSGPARHLIKIQGDSKVGEEKITNIYREASMLSFRLWTRRTAMKCSGLDALRNTTFDVESPFIAAHTLVRYDEHEDQLKGRPITVIVHPLVEVFGTDEATDYDMSKVWMRAEVWLDSK